MHKFQPASPQYAHQGTDALGPDYENLRFDLPADREGPVIATVVRRLAAPNRGRAVLMIHGLADYFFQTHVAEYLLAAGWSAYGIDLHKYGRSLLVHQTPNLCGAVEDYFAELDLALDVIEEDGASEVLVWAHSTGGLIASLWAHARKNDKRIAALFLNSPFFDFNLPWIMRRPVLAAAATVGRLAPRVAIPQSTTDLFAKYAHRSQSGKWDYDLSLKPAYGFPIRAGWLSAMQSAQRQLRQGLNLHIPILVGFSTRTYNARSSPPIEAAHSDVVLNVNHIARWAPSLGRCVTLCRFEHAMHDLTLSSPPVRMQVLETVESWTRVWSRRQRSSHKLN